jgi:mono/diheme cytochrome c family protein
MECRIRTLACLALIAAAGLIATSGGARPQRDAHSPWSGCCGVKPWSQGRGDRIGQSVTGSSMLRNQAAILEGVPDAYADLRNPLPRTRATIERGAGVYARSCAQCHGDTGLGDGSAGRALAHPPANLAWLSRMPTSLWDPFMYWTIAEGGALLHTAMPSFKASLSERDSWAVIAYIQARVPRRKPR